MSLCIQSSLQSQTMETTVLSVPVTFTKCHIHGIIQEVFCIRLFFFSLTMTHLTFIHIVVCICSLFFFVVEQYSIVWLDHNILICSPSRWTFVLLQFWVIMSKVTAFTYRFLDKDYVFISPR